MRPHPVAAEDAQSARHVLDRLFHEHSPPLLLKLDNGAALVEHDLRVWLDGHGAPGVAAISADGFATPPLRVLEEGRLLTLTPSFYGSRKTGLPHVPIASSGWELLPSDSPRAELIRSVARGALVGRLSMGRPAANGDFSGVIKNSFLLEDGQVGRALSETMVTGNIARMLHDVTGLNRERIDTGAWRLPWMRVAGLYFS